MVLETATELPLFVPAHFVGAGILLVAAATAILMGLHRGRTPSYLAYGLTCVLSAGVATCSAIYYMAGSIAAGTEAMRWAWTFGALLLGAMVLFIAYYTEVPRPHTASAIAWVPLAAFIAANHSLENGVRFGGTVAMSYHPTPWGEWLFALHGPGTWWITAFRAGIVVMIAWAVRRLLAARRRPSGREAVFLASFLVLLLASAAHGALIDSGYLRPPASIGLVLVGLALMMGLNLMMRLKEDYLELASAARALRERAYGDATTGLPNRLYVQDRLREQAEEGVAGTHSGLIIVDLDHFKVLNDALTHEVGDLVLREVGARVCAACGGEAVAARLDGDAFVALLAEPRAGAPEAYAAIESVSRSVAQALARPMEQGERSFNLSASMGLVTFAAREAAGAEVLGRAEMALHHAKQRGRNNVQPFLAAFQEEAAERYRLVEGLRRALEDHELELHYQPQMDRDGTVVGAEALMRWTSAALGPVSPARFIPVAEETGMIHAIGAWSLRLGCQRLASWQREGSPFKGHLSVNVSPWQLARGDFVHHLRVALEESGADPTRLVLEITESAVLFDLHETIAKLREIRTLGPRIALDDFGTGYSSLALIRDLPLDIIKIDQAFVRQLAHGVNPRLVRVIVAIGEELGLEVIAEGVETPADRDSLLALGCARLQGYLIGRPMPEAAFLEYVRAHHGVAGTLTV